MAFATRSSRKQRYWFSQEQTKVANVTGTSKSVFKELALTTGAGFCHPPGKLLPIEKLAPYLVETADLLEAAVALPPKLVPLRSADIWRDDGKTWLRVEVRRSELLRRGLGSRLAHEARLPLWLNISARGLGYELGVIRVTRGVVVWREEDPAPVSGT